MPTKTCRKCKKSKSLAAFYQKSDGRLGRMAQCKECVKAKEQELSTQPKKSPPEKRCSRCKQVKGASDFYKRSATVTGLHAYCKVCCDRARKTPRQMYTKYKCTAKSRKIPFHLTLEEFLLFEKLPCFYCGAVPEWLGLDRIDSKRPYEVLNVVRCCPPCNYSKRTQSVEEWLDHIEKVLRHMRRTKTGATS